MMVYVDLCVGLQDFRQIQHILVMDASICFISRQIFALYHEYLRASELCNSHVCL